MRIVSLINVIAGLARRARLVLPALLLWFPMGTMAQAITIEKVIDGLDQPWSLGLLPEDAFLVTERDQRKLLYVSAQRQRREISGLPKIVKKGQGGLLDVLVPRNFKSTRQVFLSYAIRQGRGQGTAVGVGRLSDDATSLIGFKQIFEMSPGSKGKTHFGGRLAESPDGSLFLSIGERGDRPAAQDLGRHNGSVIHTNKDGSVPSSNPFAQPSAAQPSGAQPSGAQPEIWSFGHRNPQGLTFDPQGRLWAVEHGAKGGDEINLIQKSGNYGWPVISYGTHYSGAKIGEGTSKPGMIQPRFFWDPSIAPSGFMIYSGRLWPEWTGQMFIGSLKFDLISRVSRDGRQELQRIKSAQTGRVRDIREAPDGSIWFLSVGNGAVYRMTP